MSHRNVLAVTALTMLFVGCTAGGPDDRGDLDPRRKPLSKADSLGTCENACGGQSQDGSCWCDELCEFYGDCCDDYAPTCADDPQVCGGFGGPFECPPDEYCHHSEGTCGAADEAGLCMPKPDACIEIFAPVCGCDGNTYVNECYAHAAGTSVASNGACESEELCLGDGDCEMGEHCDTSECHTPCPEGMDCAQVCYGVCEDSDPPPPPEELCWSDDDCDPDQFCDHSECHSPDCPEGMACPPVCYGVCKDSSDPPPPPADSCEGSCGGPAPAGCYCDDLCTSYGDCCDDYAEICEPGQGCCPASEQPGENGNPPCIEGATCCADGTWACNDGSGSPVCEQGMVCGA